MEEFKIFLIYEKGIKFTSFIKSAYLLLSTYFHDKDFTRENVRMFLFTLSTTTQLKEEILKSSTVNKYIRVIKLIASYFKMNDFNDFKGLKIKECDTLPKGDLISDPDMKRITQVYLKRNRDERLDNLRFTAALTLMRFTGIPPDDLTSLTWAEDKVTHFEHFRGKTGKKMILPIVPELRCLLDKLPRYSHNLVFGSHHGKMKPATINLEIKRRCDLLGIKGHITAYSFRGSMITWCLINGGEGMLVKLSMITGHTIDTMIKHYAKLDSKSVIDALYLSHPGLIKCAGIDTVKRMAIQFLSKFIDVSKFQVNLEITPKAENVRIVHLS